MNNIATTPPPIVNSVFANIRKYHLKFFNLFNIDNNNILSKRLHANPPRSDFSIDVQHEVEDLTSVI